MVSFIARRVLVSILILIAASFIMYVLAASAGNPLQDLQGSLSPNRQALIEARIHTQHLDLISPLRWVLWLGGVAKCIVPVAGGCDLGTTFQNQAVIDLLPQAMTSTLQLVTIAFVFAIVLGIALGIVTALRVYSGFDYVVTLISFFLFSLPSFLMAVLLKSFIALGYNNFLAKPDIPPLLLIVIGVVVGAVLQLLVGGTWQRRLYVFLGSSLFTALILWYMSATGWFTKPSLGPVAIIVITAGIGFAVVAILAGLRNRRAWLTAGINVVLAIASYFGLQGLFNVSSAGTLIVLGIVALAVGIVSGVFTGGHDKGLMMRIGGITSVLTAGIVLLDRFMQSWSAYTDAIGGRPIATVGSQTPSLGGDVWISGLDSFTHLLLPTISLLLISFASYTRYSRSGMLEVLNQDYVRTARAKGLPERTVIVRHAFRNMLIPLATLVATDIGALLGGAVITETVFAISGMGALFNNGLQRTDVNPVMGYFLVIAITAIAFNFLADLAYAALDPRVRVR
ncbi:MAG TPA: ABC transporter permease [Lacisediminihabitans sp.]|uniref:ABC transporter permease n=1 Tax=Lacisediminihabitans sp. TaxID=2787631 RepID=UPI002EDA03DA